MRDKIMNRWSTYEPFYVELGDKKIADVFITNHAHFRWKDRIDDKETSIEHICNYMWEQLKNGNVSPYYPNEKEVFLVENDLVMVVEFSVLKDEFDISGNPLHKLIVVTFLGKMSETIELRDLKSYYSWLRHSRRMTLIKNYRKKR
ncbi:hypothetical protein [Longirhabdus pacifica]|uniref:hypothetical protein n=1 Tax=Longirhabdus pacifica TaxID=2305227 RepID=UPI0010087F9F|nr:hypothetical protein [Longirhabdus pacifica]